MIICNYPGVMGINTHVHTYQYTYLTAQVMKPVAISDYKTLCILLL